MYTIKLAKLAILQPPKLHTLLRKQNCSGETAVVNFLECLFVCIKKGRRDSWNNKYNKLTNTKLNKVTEETFSVEKKKKQNKTKNLKSFSGEIANTQEEWVEGTIT